MIICPNCKEEIEDNSCFCDQCGHALLFCNKCGRVGLGKRCTHCGGLMMRQNDDKMGGDDLSNTRYGQFVQDVSLSSNTGANDANQPPQPQSSGLPILMLVNSSLNIRIVAINGAIIGRKQGPYSAFFARNMYVSGVHAQLFYDVNTGWSIADKHSSNGTMLNQHRLRADERMSLKDADIVTIANVSLTVKIN